MIMTDKNTGAPRKKRDSEASRCRIFLSLLWVGAFKEGQGCCFVKGFRRHVFHAWNEKNV
jgi:hypothetical protein